MQPSIPSCLRRIESARSATRTRWTSFARLICRPPARERRSCSPCFCCNSHRRRLIRCDSSALKSIRSDLSISCHPRCSIPSTPRPRSVRLPFRLGIRLCCCPAASKTIRGSYSRDYIYIYTCNYLRSRLRKKISDKNDFVCVIAFDPMKSPRINHISVAAAFFFGHKVS